MLDSIQGLIEVHGEVNEIVAQITIYFGIISQLMSTDVFNDQSFENFNEFFEGKVSRT